MLKIITNIPLFVWPLLSVLLRAGIKARKASEVSLTALVLIPSLFFAWSFLSFFGKYMADPIATLLWPICFGMGFFVGFSHMKRQDLRIDKDKKTILMPGSWIPLFLSMSIFISKFSIGMMSSMLPHLNGSLLFLCLELFTTIILGIFVGRGVSCLIRYKNYPSPSPDC